MVQNQLIDKIKVRAVYNPNRGLFLIKTKKSGLCGLWTTPGGEIEERQDKKEGLIELIYKETGLVPLSIKPTPFYHVEYDNLREMTHVKMFVYQVSLNVIPDAELSNPYRFFPLNYVNTLKVTRETGRILKSNEFYALMKA